MFKTLTRAALIAVATLVPVSVAGAQTDEAPPFPVEISTDCAAWTVTVTAVPDGENWGMALQDEPPLALAAQGGTISEDLNIDGTYSLTFWQQGTGEEWGSPTFDSGCVPAVETDPALAQQVPPVPPTAPCPGCGPSGSKGDGTRVWAYTQFHECPPGTTTATYSATYGVGAGYPNNVVFVARAYNETGMLTDLPDKVLTVQAPGTQFTYYPLVEVPSDSTVTIDIAAFDQVTGTPVLFYNDEFVKAKVLTCPCKQQVTTTTTVAPTTTTTVAATTTTTTAVTGSSTPAPTTTVAKVTGTLPATGPGSTNTNAWQVGAIVLGIGVIAVCFGAIPIRRKRLVLRSRRP